MKKRLLALLLTAALILTLFPVTAAAEGPTVLEVGGGTYALSETGLSAAIASASDGDTIKFTASGTITLTDDIVINKSVTLDLNGQTVGLNSPSTFDYLSIPYGYSVTVTGPGTITTNTYIYVKSTATLTVQGGVVIEAAGSWQALMNYGTVSMTGGTLRQTNGNCAFQNSGTATLDNVTIENSSANISVIWAADGALALNNCTARNNFSGPMTGTLPSVIFVTNSAAVTLNGGSVTAPAGATLPAILVYKNATLINNGAAISGGYVTKISDLSVSVSSAADKVTLAPQTAEPGVTYYYKITAADDTEAKPSYDTAFDSAGWTAFSAPTDIATESTAAVYVQVVKVGDSTHRIYGWGQGSAVPTPPPAPTVTPSPTAAPAPTATPVPTPTATASPMMHTASVYVNGRTTLTASVSGGAWHYDSKYLKLTDNGNGTVAIKGLKAGTTTVTYSAGDMTETFTVTIAASMLPATGQDFIGVWALGAAAAAVLGYACLMLHKKKHHA